MFMFDYLLHSFVFVMFLFLLVYIRWTESIYLSIIFVVVNSVFFLKLDFMAMNKLKVLFILILFIMFFQILSLVGNNPVDMKFLMFMVLLGSIIIIISENLMLIYLGLELQTFSLFILMTSNSTSIKSSEGGLKYFVLGALSSGLFLLSVSLLFYLVGDVNMNDLKSINFDLKSSILMSILMLLSLFFKLSMFPLHFWIPDMYEASNTEIMALVGSLPKVSVLFILIYISIPSSMLFWCSIGSIMVGTIGALNQTKMKSLLAYSGIVHMGLAVLTLGLFMKLGLEPTIMYMLMYMLTFMPLIMLITLNSNISYLSDLSGLQNINVLFSLSWSLFLLSMAGLPPLSGFLTKWWTISTIINNSNNFIGFLCVLFSAVGLVYYLSMTKMAYFQNSSSYLMWNSMLNCGNLSLMNKVYLAFGLYLSCLLMFNPNPFILLVDMCIYQ